MRLVVLMLGLGLMVQATAQWLDLPTPGVPRLADGTANLAAPAPVTAWGDPDLSGIWAATRVTGDLPESDKFMPWVQEAMDRHAANFYADQPRYNCLPSGPAYLNATAFSTGMRRMVQTPDHLAILHEDMVHRQIFMDGRELEPDPLPTWMGYSVAHWEENVLIVESNGYNDKTWLDRRGVMHSEKLQIVERYQRLDWGKIQLDVTYVDPLAFTAPLNVSILLELQLDDQLLEYVCNETDQLGANWVGSTDQAELQQVEISPEVLQSYAGIYEGYWLGNLIRLDFRLEESELTLDRNGVEVELYPRSQTAFDASNGFGFIFELDDTGKAVSVEEVHVSGGWPFPRVE